MKTSTLVSLLFCVVCSLRAQITVTDDFSSGSHWTATTVNGTGGFGISSGRANYTSSSATDAYLLWNVGTYSYTSNWETQVDVRAKQASGAAPFDYFYGSLAVYRTGDTFFAVDGSDVPQYYSVSADIIRPGGSTNAFQTSYVVAGDNFYEDPSNGAGITANTTNGSLRVSFDSTAKTLTTWYDANGATGGYSWTQISSINIASDVNWGMTNSSTFSLALAVNSGSDVLTSGNVYFDNFSVTAVPEPSTYAAFAGVGALGLAFWRKRRRGALWALPVLACIAGAPVKSSAQTITIQVQGTIYSSYTYNGTGLTSIIPVNSAFTATWTYDASTLVSTTAGNIGPGNVQESTIYGFSDFTATFTANGYTFTAPIGSGGAGVTIFDNSTAIGSKDGIKLIGRTSGTSAPTQNSFYLNSISLQLLTPTLSTFADQALSHASEGATFVSQPAGTNNMLLISAQSPTNVSFLTELYGSVTSYSYSVSAVPEPSTYAAFAGLGALGLAFWRKRRQAAIAVAPAD